MIQRRPDFPPTDTRLTYTTLSRSLPGRYLKTITRTGLGVVAFEPIRAEAGNILEDARWKGAPILVAGANFGCGSSREHAVWAMMDLGIRAEIGRAHV